MTDSVKYVAWDGSCWFFQTVEHNVSELGSVGNLALDSNENPHLCYFSEGALNYACWDGSTWVVHALDFEPMSDDKKPYVWLDKDDKANLFFVNQNSSSGPYDDPCSLFPVPHFNSARTKAGMC